MSQPSNLPRWADTVSGDTTRVFQPTSGKADVGWAEGERPAEQHMNWLLWTIYLWCVYLKNLKDEAFTWTAAHAFSAAASFAGGISGAVAAAGAWTFGSTVAVASNLTVGGITTLNGVIDLNGTIDAGGITTLGGLATGTAISVNAGAITLNPSGNIACTGNVSGVAGVYSGAVSGTTGTFSGVVSGSDLKHTVSFDRPMTAMAGSSDNGDWQGGFVVACKTLRTATSSDILYIPVVVESGDTLTSWSYNVANGDGVDALRLRLTSTALVSIDTVDIPAGTGAAIATRTISHAVVAGNAYYVTLEAVAATNSADTMTVRHVSAAGKRI